jgi:pyruvate/2-oxoglutarate dehydrogenase complex dihydrolipoamide acyltransferase (E2) component
VSGIVAGKRALVVGVANKRSIAWAIARRLDEEGARVALTFQGDRVEKEQSLISLESDKATMEIPSPAAGVLKELKVKIGDKISEGTVVLLLDAEGASAPAAAVAAPARPGPAAGRHPVWRYTILRGPRQRRGLEPQGVVLPRSPGPADGAERRTAGLLRRDRPALGNAGVPLVGAPAHGLPLVAATTGAPARAL